VTRAAALDSFDLGVGLCLEASIDEIQVRHALVLAVNGTEAALIRDFGVRRREPDGGLVWHVPSSFLEAEELTPDAPESSRAGRLLVGPFPGWSAVRWPVSRRAARPRLARSDRYLTTIVSPDWSLGRDGFDARGRPARR
jgi:hypothetical protein